LFAIGLRRREKLSVGASEGSRIEITTLIGVAQKPVGGFEPGDRTIELQSRSAQPTMAGLALILQFLAAV
jgi:hypothetical protein